ncbi:unnamed protein product [Candida verbasci]|uniref:ATP-dependent RNA helicase n=1 Tax=Candida verbasci TaxID=1227364 RepID=A0A9W4TYX1_9ASCO|nr:unnamed protein product [Candida verbasci]
MDEDDGLLLNFDTNTTSNDSKVSSSKVKGGRWKDRRKLQLSLQGKKPKPKTTGVNNIEIDESKLKQPQQPQTKKPRIDQRRFTETKGEFGGKNESYVSSLFSNNQDTQLKITKESENIKHTPSNAPIIDTNSFNGLGLNEKLSSHLTEHLKFKYPTKVQKLVLPKLLNSIVDLFVKAQTGSGKTLAFLLPILNQLMIEDRLNRESGLFAMILTPTRELANQIYHVLESLTRCYHHIVPGIVIGGEKKKSEKARLRKGVNILVGTPGRLADHLENTKSVDVSQLRWLVLDEGDKLIELGFEETITKITTKIESTNKINQTITKWPKLPSKRINVLCSATLQNNVKKLGQMILNEPEMISVDNETENTITFQDTTHSTAPDQLIQDILVVPSKLRLVTLNALLKNISTQPSKTIVFFSCSDSVDYHFDVFTRSGKQIKNEEEEDSGILTAPIINDSIIYKLHGSLSQQIRTKTLESFIKDRSESNKILFCTDVASRGLDLPNITNVIEYDAPFTIDDHLHRIGRSARVGNQGKATLFLLPGIEEGYVDNKLKIVHPKQGNLRIINYESPLQTAFAEGESKSKDQKIGKWDIHATTWHLDVERWLLEDQSAMEKAIQAFTSHIRAYTTHLNSEKQFFNVKTLHLGHLAKSFGLRETPKKLGKSVNVNQSAKVKKEDPRKKMLRIAKMAAKDLNSEFNY